MKKFLPFFFLPFHFLQLYSQSVGIGDVLFVPHPSSMLEVRATNKGVLFPRIALLSTTDNTTIPSPEIGLLVFNTATINDITPGYYCWDGVKWAPLINSGTQSTADTWLLEGNTGTNPANHFVGTTDNTNLRIATNSTTRIEISGNGEIRMYGDFLNQALEKTQVSCTTNVNNPIPTGQVPATTLNLPTNLGGVSTREYSQILTTHADVNQASIIDGTTKSITIVDGPGNENSGVLVLGSVSIRTLNNSSLPNANRFLIWVQRSNDNFTNNIVNVWKIESAVASGITTGSPYNIATGNITVPIIYADLDLSPGTYTYRLVFQGGNYGTSGGTVNFEALDRTLVLLQIKR